MKRLARAVALYLAASQAVVLSGAAWFYGAADLSAFLRTASVSLVALAAIFLIVLAGLHLLRRQDALVERGGIGLANRLTLLRLVLISPTACLLADDHPIGALVLYAASGITDVLDGAWARRRGEETRFGVMMDPAADILTTAAVYGVFWAKALLPGWVFALLLFRYASLGAGSLALHFAVAPIRFRATLVGKIAGVLQWAAAAAIMGMTAMGLEWREDVGRFLYPLLAIVFGSVIVSQGIAAVRHIERGRAHAGSSGRSHRLSAHIDHADAEPRGGHR